MIPKRAWRLALLVLAAVWLCGCASEGSVTLPSWVLEARGIVRPVTLPAHFDRELGEAAQTYVLRARVPLAPVMRGQPLTVTIAYFGGLATMRAGSLDAPDVDTNSLERYRSNGPHRFLVPAAATSGEALDLEMTVAHTWTQSAWFDTVPRLSPGDRGDLEYALVSTFDQSSAAAALSMILLVSLAYAIVYLADRRRAVYGWFVVASFAGASYSAWTLGLLQPLFGVYDLAAVGVLITVSAVSAIKFTAGVFGKRASNAWWLLVAAWLVMAVYANGPFRSTRWLSPIAIGSTVCAGVYCSSLLARELRRGRPPLASVLASVAWPAVCVLALDDFAAWLSLGELYHGARGASLGTMAVSLLQAAALAAQLMESLRVSDALNIELAGRVSALERTNAEVHTLNEELRRQIGSRSLELAETLARVGSVHLPVLALEEGDLVGGRYRVTRFVGSGGMAWVYEVQRTSDGRRLALKLLHGRSSGPALARFAREAHLASEVPHPAIVGVVDVDITPEGILYIVMDYVDGRPLEDYLDSDPAAAWALVVLRGIAEGLEAVHARGVIHRDLKPANILVAEGDGATMSVKIADFGVATLHDDGARIEQQQSLHQALDGRMTRAGRVMGTPVYMAPELALEGTPPHPSVDMYAFGVIAHELLVGRPPFRDPLYVRRLHGRSLPAAPSLATFRPRLDRTVAHLVDRCLSLDPSTRPTAKEAVEILRHAHLEADPLSVPSLRV